MYPHAILSRKSKGKMGSMIEREMDVRPRSTLHIIPRSLEFVNGAVEVAESLSQGMAL